MTRNLLLLLVSAAFLTMISNTDAAVIKEYAENRYDNHSVGRAEKKCMEDGYKITYANCEGQTAPSERCPNHDLYYRSCSQEQWCRNNNYTFLPQDCELPTYPVKLCDNKFEIYRSCEKDTARACKEQGYKSAKDCSLSDERCEFDKDYGKCCDECPDFPYAVNSIPDGYVAVGKTCKTCGGIVKTKVKEAPCEGFEDCKYGPASMQTAFCLQGKKVLYNNCKAPDVLCRERGYVNISCNITEDAEDCVEYPDLKKCKINCYKYAQVAFPQSDVIANSVVNPTFDAEKTEIRSLYGKISSECEGRSVPIVKLNINKDTLQFYHNVLSRNINDVNFIINFEDETTLEANGSWKNVKVKIEGTPAKCALKADKLNVAGKVAISGVGDICANVDVAELSKFTVGQNLVGNVNLDGNSQLGIRGDLTGLIKTSAYCEVLIKGKINYQNKQGNSADSEGIIFGCNTQVKVEGGINVETANIILRQYALLDTPAVNMTAIGVADSGAASLHLYKYAKITNVLDDTEYNIADNSGDASGNCDDKYILYKTSALDGQGKVLSLNAADLLENQWQCRKLGKLQMRCN